MPAGVASPELSHAARSESANPASWKALSPPMPALSGKAPLPQPRGTCRSGSRPPATAVGGMGRTSSSPPNHPVHPAWCHPGDRASTHRTLASTTITNSPGYGPKLAAKQLIGPPDTAVLRRPCLSWIRKGLGSHGLPGHPRTCRRASRERRRLSCPCTLPTAVRPHQRTHDSRKLFSNNIV